MMISDLNKRPEEGEVEYLWRLGNLRADGLVDMTWTELTDVLNENLHEPEDYLGESSYRKRYTIMKQAYDEIFSKMSGCEEEKLTILQRELEKEKVKVRDEKNDYKRILREQARRESFEDIIRSGIQKINEKTPLSILNASFPALCSEKEAVACFSDWHYGLITDNVWNKYDTEICAERVLKCVKYMAQYLVDHKIRKLDIVVLGDMSHGCTHSCALYTREDVCDQLMHASELLAEAVTLLSRVVDSVEVYFCYGNHMRTTQKKEEAKPSDNMEKIVPWWLQYRLADNKRIHVNMSGYGEFTYFKVLNKYNIVCMHGNDIDFKSIGVTANSLFTRILGENIDYTISGDKHHLEEFEKYGIESILVRSLCGTDDYASSRHLFGKAGQTLMIFNEDYGRECTYHIPL